MLKAKQTRRVSEFHQEAFDEVSRVKMHRINVDVPVEKFKRFKAMIVLDPEFKTISEAVNVWIDQYLDGGQS